MNLRQDVTKKRMAYIVVGIIVTAVLYQGEVVAVNYAYNEDLSRFVTETPCGLQHTEPGEELGAECPGKLQCFDDFDADRVGANISEPRCVKPAYEKYYCDFMEYTEIQASHPASMDACYDAPIEELPLTILAIYLPSEITGWLANNIEF